MMKVLARSQNGFSLVELMMALGIGTFLIVAGVSLHVSNIGYIKSTDARSTLYQDSLLVSEYLRSEIMGAGGGAMRGWMGIWVEDNCAARSVFPACQNSDRLAISSVTVPLQECQVTGMVSSTVLQIGLGSGGACCLIPQAASEEVSFNGRDVVLTLNDFYLQRHITAVDLGTCRATIGNVPAAVGSLPGSITDWTNATMSMVQIETIYWKSSDHTLRRFIDANGDNAVDAGEDLIIADNIYDFQMALGYDFSPADGSITESADGVNDEWLFNAPGVTEAYGTSPFIAPLTRSQMSFVTASLIFGISDPAAVLVNRRALNGPYRSQVGVFLEENRIRLAPRNAYIFQ